MGMVYWLQQFFFGGVTMEYSKVLDCAMELGYQLAMCGAETFRVEESITLVLRSYGIDAEVFVIPNCMHISIATDSGQPLTRMRRIGNHGNDLNGMELYSALSRAICNRRPNPNDIPMWMDRVEKLRRVYSTPVMLLGDFLGAAGFSVFFGGSLMDALCGGLCGILVGLVGKFMTRWRANPFFSTLANSFLMAALAYAFGLFGLSPNPDCAIIGALMILVPGLLFTNAMRDIIYGDTNSGINRIVQVLLIAVAIALGTATAWRVFSFIAGSPISSGMIVYSAMAQALSCLIGCVGFTILFNIHGKGTALCVLGGVFSWAVYAWATHLTGSDLMGYFWGAVFASAYSEIMARIRKCPALPFLVVCIFPLIPGAGVYYTMNYAVRGEMELFAQKGMHTAAVAGLLAVGILLVSTIFRMYSNWKMQRKLT